MNGNKSMNQVWSLMTRWLIGHSTELVNLWPISSWQQPRSSVPHNEPGNDENECKGKNEEEVKQWKKDSCQVINLVPIQRCLFPVYLPVDFGHELVDSLPEDRTSWSWFLVFQLPEWKSISVTYLTIFSLHAFRTFTTRTCHGQCPRLPILNCIDVHDNQCVLYQSKEYERHWGKHVNMNGHEVGDIQLRIKCVVDRDQGEQGCNHDRDSCRPSCGWDPKSNHWGEDDQKRWCIISCNVVRQLPAHLDNSSDARLWRLCYWMVLAKVRVGAVLFRKLENVKFRKVNVCVHHKQVPFQSDVSSGMCHWIRNRSVNRSFEGIKSKTWTWSGNVF